MSASPPARARRTARAAARAPAGGVRLQSQKTRQAGLASRSLGSHRLGRSAVWIPTTSSPTRSLNRRKGGPTSRDHLAHTRRALVRRPKGIRCSTPDRISSCSSSIPVEAGPSPIDAVGMRGVHDAAAPWPSLRPVGGASGFTDDTHRPALVLYLLPFLLLRRFRFAGSPAACASMAFCVHLFARGSCSIALSPSFPACSVFCFWSFLFLYVLGASPPPPIKSRTSVTRHNDTRPRGPGRRSRESQRGWRGKGSGM